MTTDNYTIEYQQKQAQVFLSLLATSKPRYNQIVTDTNDNIEISCDGAFKQVFANIDKAIKYLRKHQK